MPITFSELCLVRYLGVLNPKLAAQARQLKAIEKVDGCPYPDNQECNLILAGLCAYCNNMVEAYEDDDQIKLRIKKAPIAKAE